VPLADSEAIHDPARVEKLRSLALLDTVGGPEFDRLTHLASKILKAPISLVSLADAERQYFVSQVGLAEPYATLRETPITDSFCQHVVSTKRPLIVDNARQHPLVFDRLVISDLGIAAYAGMPLITSDGYVLGAFCVADHRTRQWTDDDLEILAELAKSAVTEIELRSELQERQRVEAALRESEQLLQGIMNATPDSIYVYDLLEHRNVFAGREVHRLLGYTPEQLAPMGNQFLQSLMHPDDQLRMPTHFERLMQIKHGDVLEWEYRMRHANGEWRWMASRDTVFKRRPDGAVWQIIGVARDITERRQIEETARANERHLRAVVSNAPLVLFSTDAEGVITLSVGKALEALGRQQNESVGQSIFERYREQEEMVQQMRRALAGETVAGLLELEHTVYDTWYSPICADDGTITGMIGVSIDITERVHAEQALHDTLQQLIMLRKVETELSRSLSLAHVLLVAADIVLRVTGARDGYIGLFDSGAIQVVHAIGHYRRGEKHDVSTGIVGRVVPSRTAALIPDVSVDSDYVPRLPHTRSLMCVPLIYGARFIGIIDLESPAPDQFSTDAFEFVKLIAGQLTLAIDNAQLYEVAQEQLADMAGLYARVSELEQLKTDIIRIAAHDLRNPLTQVLGYGSLLLETTPTLDAEQKEFTEAILKAGSRMESLITDILSLQRIEAMAGGQHKEVVDLSKLVQTAFADHQARAQQKGQSYTLTLPETPARVNGDSAQLREAVDNLIGNAIKYTPEAGSITVRLSLEDANRVILEVQDSGIGIPADQQARLFQPFYRANTQETAQIEGTGLGLHLVKNIIQRHQGKMRFSSTYGQGSSFGFEMKRV
jgi:PAS domain S-box-containing protein